MKTFALLLLLGGALALAGCSSPYQGGAEEGYATAMGTAGSPTYGPGSADQLYKMNEEPPHREFPTAPPAWPPR